VSLADVADGRSAPNVDSHPTGTSLRDFVRGSDASPLPEDVVALYDSGPVDIESAVFRPAVADTLV
jgi:hypothetical protein